MAKPAAPGTQLSKDDIKFLEATLASLPTQKTGATDGEADGLLKFGYHQNPYVRTFCKVLWSGFALARGQLGEGSQRFSQARRDATVSNIDQGTIKALDEAAAALEQAMAPSGTINSFLAELRDRTMQRCWSRVCETCGLPPPRFHVLYGKKPALSTDELDAQEEAEMAALLRNPPPGAEPPDDDDFDEGEDEEDEDSDEDADEGDDDTEGENDAEAPGDRAGRQAPREARAAPAVGAAIQVRRTGGAELVPELLLSAASEALRELRTHKPTGTLRITVTIDAQQGEARSPDTKGDGGEQRRRRRRRR